MNASGAGEDRLEELLDDFRDEVRVLDELVAALDDAAWLAPTPAEGWDVRDSIAHLALADEVAYDCATRGRSPVMDEAVRAMIEGGDGAAAMEERVITEGRRRSPAEVLEWWRTSNGRLRDALGRLAPDERVPWGPNRMSVASFTTARLMETWAHGLDCFDSVGVQPVYTERLRHIAFLSLRALPYAFMIKGADAPGPVRLELTSPSGELWALGPDDAPTVIRGVASDWCRVATHRDRRDERGRIEARGPDAEAVLEYVQAYL